MRGSHIAPGDLVLADADGVVVAPKDLAHEAGESTVLADLLEGASLSDVWERYGLL